MHISVGVFDNLSFTSVSSTTGGIVQNNNGFVGSLILVRTDALLSLSTREREKE